jgi:predicted permease
MARLRDGVTRTQANAALPAIWRDELEVTTPATETAERRARFLSRQTSLEPGRAGFSRVRRQFEQPLWMLLALVALLCVVACASAANLLIARAASRRRELAVRLAIGAGRGRLIRQQLTESLVWSGLGAAAGLLLAQWLSQALVAMMTTADLRLAVDVTPNIRILAFAAAITLITVAASSLLPAVAATRLKPGLALRDQDQPGRGLLRGWSSGRALVALQVALTLVLVLGASLFTRSLAAAMAEDTGYDRRGVLVVSADTEAAGLEGERLAAFQQALHDRLGALPGVRGLALARYPPITNQDGAWTQSITVEGTPLSPDAARVVYFNVVSPGYFSTLALRFHRGRDFSSADRESATRVVIVNELLARRSFGDADPIGRRISVGRAEQRRDLEIVGVVANAKYQTLHEEPRAIAYLPVAQHPSDDALAAVLRIDAARDGLGDAIRREIRALDRSVPIRIETVGDRIAGSLVVERVIASLASAIGVTALVLAGAALYGLLAYAVSRRRRELGIRVALGADQAVAWTVLRDCLVVAAVGIAIGLAASLALGRFAAALLFKVAPSDAPSMAIASVVVLIVCVAAALLPARRAVGVDAVTVMRAE